MVNYEVLKVRNYLHHFCFSINAFSILMYISWLINKQVQNKSGGKIKVKKYRNINLVNLHFFTWSFNNSFFLHGHIFLLEILCEIKSFPKICKETLLRNVGWISKMHCWLRDYMLFKFATNFVVASKVSVHL